MTLHPVRVLRATRALWRRDRSLLMPIAGLFLFVPQWAILLLVPEAPPFEGGANEQASAAWSEALSAWVATNGLAYILAALASQFGTLAIASLYMGPGAGQVGSALRRAAMTFGRYLLAALIIWAPMVAGATLLVSVGGPALAVGLAPVLYIAALALLSLVAPSVAAGPGSAAHAVARAWRASRGSRGPLLALAAMTMVASQLGAMVLLAVAHSLRTGGGDNPIVLAAVYAGASLVLASGALVLALAGPIIYRALAR